MVDDGGTTQRSRPARWASVVAGGVGRVLLILGVVLAGGWVVDRVFFGPTQLEAAYEACDEDHAMVYIEVRDDGSSISVDDLAAESQSPQYQARMLAALDCLLEELGTSEALRADLDATTALMGRQSAAEDGLEYRWSYHPDSGVSMTIREE